MGRKATRRSPNNSASTSGRDSATPVSFLLTGRRSKETCERSAAYDVAAEAASRNVALHEAAHALQMAAWVRCRLPLARTLFASSSYLEGWATYLESEVRPYLSPVDQLVSLQRHLCRAAKAFLEPGLHEGTVRPEEAARVLREDAALSPATVRAELERYTFLCPGQALTYLAGYLREIELRAEAELATRRSAFRVREYHDRPLGEGFLPFP